MTDPKSQKDCKIARKKTNHQRVYMYVNTTCFFYANINICTRHLKRQVFDKASAMKPGDVAKMFILIDVIIIVLTR